MSDIYNKVFTTSEIFIYSTNKERLLKSFYKTQDSALVQGTVIDPRW
jgi:hypothetical protein